MMPSRIIDKVVANLRAAIPTPIKIYLREITYRFVVPGYSSAPVRRSLTQYIINDDQVAKWSPDHQQPHGAIEDTNYLPHFLLARTVLKVCRINSWCDLGSGVGSLPLAVARLGVNEILAIDGSNAGMRSGLVRLPSSNYLISDLTHPFTINLPDGTPAKFELVSALELLEHIPEDRLNYLFANIHRMNPNFLLLSLGLQPDPPYHVNLKTMQEWIQRISEAFPGYVLDEYLSQEIFIGTGKHARFKNEYATNCFKDNRNLLVFVRCQ